MLCDCSSSCLLCDVIVCIVLSGEDIEHHHCSIVMAEEGESKVKLLPHEGKCFINHMEADQDTDLSHGESARERRKGKSKH